MIENPEKELIILNNKCNFTKNEFITYLKKIENTVRTYHHTKNIILCPSMCYLSIVDTNYLNLGSQNVSENDFGNYTGEISAKQLKSLNVKYSIVGHQETRKNNNEANININKKIKKLLEEEITPILCIGEVENNSIEEALQYINNQLIENLIGIKEEERKNIIIAYEPLWAIGGSITDYIPRIERIIKEIKEKYQNNRLVYGGGINKESIKLLKNNQYLSGYLLGNISLDINKIEQTLSELL